MMLRKWIETVTNILMIATCLLAFYVLAERRFSPAPSKVDTPALTGRRLSLPGFQGRPLLVLTISSHCPYCKASVGLYRRIAGFRRSSNSFALVAMSNEPAEGIKAFLADAQIGVDDAVQTSLNQFGVRGTPTILVVDRHGIIRSARIGKLAPNEEEEILAELKAAPWE